LLATIDQQTKTFRDDVLAGLSAPVPAIPARWLYDHRGSELFDEHWSCRASVRRRSHPTFRVDDVGFRVARSGSAR
jgi:hypothetical protein